jgi:hypothetical protein
MLIRNFSCCAALLSLLLAPASVAQAQAPAEDRWYNVELVIFKYTQPEEFGSEHWPQRWALPDAKNSAELDALDGKYQSDFAKLPADVQSFSGMLERLGKSSRYEVLNYSAWRQRGLDKAQAVGVRIRAGRRYQPQTLVPTDVDFGLFEQSFIEQDFTPEVTLRRYVETAAKSGPLLYELEGNVKIVLSRFLHVYADLLLLKPVTLTAVTNSAAQPAAGAAAGYHIAWTQASTPLGSNENAGEETSDTLYGINIKSHRKVRSGELHHLDHPLLGILIQIKPVETVKP